MPDGFRPGAVVTPDQLRLILADMADSILYDGMIDSDEGYIRYERLPYLLPEHAYNLLTAKQQEWYYRRDKLAEEWTLRDDAPANVFFVHAAYRRGNSMGQGGVRIIDADFNPFADPADPPRSVRRVS